jgi:hypothetical protein
MKCGHIFALHQKECTHSIFPCPKDVPALLLVSLLVWWSNSVSLLVWWSMCGHRSPKDVPALLPIGTSPCRAVLAIIKRHWNGISPSTQRNARAFSSIQSISIQSSQITELLTTRTQPLCLMQLNIILGRGAQSDGLPVWACLVDATSSPPHLQHTWTYRCFHQGWRMAVDMQVRCGVRWEVGCLL